MSNNALAVSNEPKQLAQPEGELFRRLKMLICNGRKLQDDEAWALTQYARATNLNPFVGECYYLPGSGPIPGIAGWRTKAQEQLDYEATKCGEHGASYSVEYEEAQPGEAVFEQGKDIAWKVIIKDYLSSKRWRQAVFEAMREFSQAGSQSAYKDALAMIGKEPEWTGVGVVKSGENFGGDKMDRNERAKKRGEKLALRKRFPRVYLPEPENYVDMEPNITIEAKHTEAEILGKLGYGEPAPKPEEKPAAKPDAEPELIQDMTHTSDMSLETAEAVTNKDGLKYCEIQTAKLAHMHNQIINTLNTHGDLSQEQRDEYNFKADAIKVILASRK